MDKRIPGCTVLAILVVWAWAVLAVIVGAAALIYAIVHFLLTH